MRATFRWYGVKDTITLEKIKQIPQMKGIVTSLYDEPIGEIWSLDKILELKEEINKYGLELDVIESLPVHEDIKLGLETKDLYIENYKESIRNLGKAGVKVICYNFMPAFDWVRTSEEVSQYDQSVSLAYEHSKIENMKDPVKELPDLPFWNFSGEELKLFLEKYKNLTADMLWENLEYFLKKVVPCAEEAGVKLAIHPDDPPWDVFGLPRIITNKESLDRLINIVDSPSNGLTICTGSLGVDSNNNLPEIIRYFGEKKRLFFLHLRNVKIRGPKDFIETAHPTPYGSLDMYEIIKACVEVGFDGPVRPDHGRMIWGETGILGYGLFDRALGITYIIGLIEAVQKSHCKR